VHPATTMAADLALAPGVISALDRVVDGIASLAAGTSGMASDGWSQGYLIELLAW